MTARNKKKPAPWPFVVELRDPRNGEWVEVDEAMTAEDAQDNASRSHARTGLDYRSRERTT